MLGFLSFLAFVCAILFVVSVALLALRIVKKKSWKPFAVSAAVSVVCVLGLSMPISQMYVPAEKPDAQSVPDTSSAVSSTANVDNSVETVENSTADDEPLPVSEQPVAPEATSEPDPVPDEPSTALEEEPSGPLPVSDLRFNGEPISDVAVRDLSGSSDVLDLFVEFDEDSSQIQMTVQVPAGADQDSVKSTGERVARYLASLACYSDSGYSMPDGESLGGLYDRYSLLLYLDDGSGGVDAYGAKVPLSPVITWRFGE